MTTVFEFCDSLQRTSWRATPRSFVALMSLYESNYLRLCRLIGEPAQLRDSRVSRLAGDCDLVLTVVEHCAYTTTLNLTYVSEEWAEHEGRPLRLPDLTVRVYRDARLAEAMALSGFAVASAVVERELAQRWHRNTVLNKWLEYCIDSGHRLTAPPKSHEDPKSVGLSQGGACSDSAG